MTRGQNDLGMDTNDHSEQNSSQMQFLTELPKNLKVIKADVNELSEHQELLQDIQKKSKKEPVWQI
jgi:DNA polymerase-3 subunit epsilon